MRKSKKKHKVFSRRTGTLEAGSQVFLYFSQFFFIFLNFSSFSFLILFFVDFLHREVRNHLKAKRPLDHRGVPIDRHGVPFDTKYKREAFDPADPPSDPESAVGYGGLRDSAVGYGRVLLCWLGTWRSSRKCSGC